MDFDEVEVFSREKSKDTDFRYKYVLRYVFYTGDGVKRTDPQILYTNAFYEPGIIKWQQYVVYHNKSKNQP